MRVDWERVPLSEIITRIDAGVSVIGMDRPAQPGESGVLKVSAVSEGRFKPEENKAVRPAELQRVGVSPLQGDILISRANTIELVGASALVDRDYPMLHLPDKLWRVVLADEARDDPTWLSYLLASDIVRKELRVRATGSSGSMKNVAQTAFLAIEVPRPPAEQQRWLGATFRQFDCVARYLTHLVAVKRERKRGLTKELLTGRRRFPEFRSLEWTSVSLGDLFRERSEKDRPHLRLLSVTGDRGVIPRESLDRRDTSNEDKSKYKRVCPGDIAYNTMRMWQGVSGLSNYEGIVSPAYTVVVPGERILGAFARHLFKLPRVVDAFWRHSQGLVNDTLNLKFPNFSKVLVTIPISLDEQASIANGLDCVEREIGLLEAQREQYGLQKRGLMQKLLAGELEIPDDA